MNEAEAQKLAADLLKKYGAAIRTFVDLKARERSGKRLAEFANALGVGPNPKVPSLAKALADDFHEQDRERQVAGFADGLRWLIEELVANGVLEHESP
jgi:hypothetical protein